jgi:hypothetical protein
MGITDVFAGLPVVDSRAVQPWYERLTGRPPDLVPNDNEVAWQLAVETIPGAVRLVSMTDPDGNRITFGQPLAG